METAVLEMITHTCPQGSDEWLALRAMPGIKTASEAPVMMGAHPNMTRNELIKQKATLKTKEYSSFVINVVFAKGHDTEDTARAILDEVECDDFYPITCTLGPYLASYDGVNCLSANDTEWEHKQWNMGLAQMVREKNLPPYIFWQLEHQLMVNKNLEKAIFTVSDGTIDNWVSMDYYRVTGREQQLLTAWAQFDKDVAEYVTPMTEVQVIGRTRTDALPVLSVEVFGELTTTDNIKQFSEQAAAIIKGIPLELTNDQEFADAEGDVKWLTEIETRCKEIKSKLTSKANLDQIFAAVDDIQTNMARAARLKLESQIKAQKLSRKQEIIDAADAVVAKALSEANLEFETVSISIVPTNFSDVIKGKRNFASMKSAIDDKIALIKIKINEDRDLVRNNLAIINSKAEGNLNLFTDFQTLAYMEGSHLELHIDSVIAKHKAEEDRKDQVRISAHQANLAAIKLVIETVPNMDEVQVSVAQLNINQINHNGMEEFAVEANELKLKAVESLSARKDYLVELATPEPEPEIELKEDAKPAVEPEEEKLKPETTQTKTVGIVTGGKISNAVSYPEKVSNAPSAGNPSHGGAPDPIADRGNVPSQPTATTHTLNNNEQAIECITTVLEGSLLDCGLNRDDDGMDTMISFGLSAVDPKILLKWTAQLRKAIDIIENI